MYASVNLFLTGPSLPPATASTRKHRMQDLTHDFFICMDCGKRYRELGECAQCREPLLDARKFEVMRACLDDDERRKTKREGRLIGIGIPISMILVTVIQYGLGKWAALIPLMRRWLGYIALCVALTLLIPV